ncbi:MAG: HAD-IA family hydrolase [Micavibrio sp.]|nr:HAD-IA family hydrolase [Micavibrio sp.]
MKTFLFADFDNTLMATEQFALPSLIDRFNALYEGAAGRALSLAEFKTHFHGQGRELLCGNLSKHFGIPVDYQQLYDDREGRMMAHLQAIPGGIPMAPNLIDSLKSLTAQGATLSFVSNNPIQRAMAAMRFADNGRGDELAALFGTRWFEAGEKQKPLPDAYLCAMSQVGASAAQSIAIEDSVTGVTAALAANMTVYAFTGFNDDAAAAGKFLKMGCAGTFADWKDFTPRL